MAGNEKTDSTNNEIELKMQTESTTAELDGTSPYVSNNNVPKENNGNGLEKNGHKRVLTTSIEATDLTSKKPRIEAPEDGNSKTIESGKDETHITKKGCGNETDLIEKADDNETEVLLANTEENNTELIEKADLLENNDTDLNKEAKENKTDLNEKEDVDTTMPCHKKGGGEVTDLSKECGERTDLRTEGGEVTDLSKKGAEITATPKKGGEITDLNKKGEEEMDIVTDDEEYYLTVHNLPSDWTYMQIKNYLDQEVSFALLIFFLTFQKRAGQDG